MTTVSELRQILGTVEFELISHALKDIVDNNGDALLLAAYGELSKDEWGRQLIVGALGDLCSGKSTELLEELITGKRRENNNIRQAAVRAYARCRRGASVGVLGPLLSLPRIGALSITSCIAMCAVGDEGQLSLIEKWVQRYVRQRVRPAVGEADSLAVTWMALFETVVVGESRMRFLDGLGEDEVVFVTALAKMDRDSARELLEMWRQRFLFSAIDALAGKGPASLP